MDVLSIGKSFSLCSTTLRIHEENVRKQRKFHVKMGTIKDKNGMDLTEAEDVKKRWQEYRKELYKIGLNDLNNHDGVITHIQPDILECEVKWALGNITTNKASGGDGILTELFQVLKNDAVKVQHSICQQISKIQQWPQDQKRSVFIPIPKKGNAKDVQTTAQVHPFHMLAWLCSKSFKLVCSST